MERLREGLIAFFFPAETDRWLSILRIGLGLQVIFYAWSSKGDWNELFGTGGVGLVNRELNEAVLSVESPFIPRLGWFVSLGASLGLTETMVLWSAWTVLFCAGCCLIVGLLSRPAAITAWLLHLSAIKSEEFLSYGMDNFTTIGLFYLMLSPLPDRLAVDYKLWRPRRQNPQVNGFCRRVLQLHVCIIYFFGGMMKSIGPEWWNGNSIWRALTSPPYNLVSPQVLITWKYVLPLLGITVCILETAYPIFIWMKQTRLFWLVAVCGMHLAIGCVMGLYLFSEIMIVLNLAAFGADYIFKRSEKDFSHDELLTT